MSNSNLKRYFQFMLVVVAAGSIYPLIYLKTNYQETILTVFGITLQQLNVIYSVLGVVFVLGYFPSGLLSDKFSSKRLLTMSLFGTSIGGFWFAQIPNYTVVLIIFFIWGVFSVFTFWSAHMKLVKLLAKPEEEGRFFGILDGGRGAIEAILASIAVIVFSSIVGNSQNIQDKESGLVAVIYMYSFVLLVVAILAALFIENDNKKKSTVEEENQESSKFEFKDILIIFKNKLIFILGAIISMSYVVTWTIYYIGGFLETNIQISSVRVSSIMVIVLWMRPIGGIAGGFLADKIGKTKTLSISLLLACLGLFGMSFLPENINEVVFYILAVLTGLFIYAIRGTYWSLLGDCHIDNKILGISVGFVSVLGYLPDMLVPILNTYLFNTFGENNGYNTYFTFSGVMGCIAILFIVCFKVVRKKQEKVCD
ncbi:MAG: MFS transporter [Oscillospiraceae bacterium]